MPDPVSPTPATLNFTKLKAKLRELFELDKADLDFGIYRVLRQRHTEIAEFLDKHLETTVRNALTNHGDLQAVQIRHDLEKAESAAQAAGISAEQSPRVMELRTKLEKGADLEATADEVYSHLLTFFSRYYQGGDFLGLHRSTVHGHERYMIPYNGEEVKLVWANMDQYYIKSSELLRDYNFKVATNLGEIFRAAPEDVFTVRFKLVEGDTEKDNRKADSKTARAFGLDAETPFVETDEKTLTIHFRYSEHPSERGLQDKLSAETEKTLAEGLPPKWKNLLFAADPTHQPKTERERRTIFQKHLRGYTAKHQFDYFIHKDLGGFLRRELDFYVKNEVMHLDDIEDSSAPKAEEYLSKIRAIRRCALPVIGMVAQLEEFQKKLWLKKKFVVETRYCITLDRVPEALYPDICLCDAQWLEWEDLVALSELKPERTLEFLKKNRHLMMDTKHFDSVFTLKLLGSVDDLDESLDGVCFHSENFQALQLISDRYREDILSIYIDPPYNTDAGPISYKNGFKSSSWTAMLNQTLGLTERLLLPQGYLCATIDDYQQRELSFLLEGVFGSDRIAGTVCIRSNPSGRPVPTGLAQAHEYAIFALADADTPLSKLPRSEKQSMRYKQDDGDGVRYMWELFRKRGSGSRKEDRPTQYYPLFVKGESVRVPAMEWDEKARIWNLHEQPGNGESIAYPIDESGMARRWRGEPTPIRNNPQNYKAKRNEDGTHTIYYKFRPKSEGVTPPTVWADARYSATEHGTGIVKSMFRDYDPFSYPKSIFAVMDCLLVMGGEDTNSTILDYFAGSGTTGHAVMNLNRDDGGQRKFILVEMGAYFDTVLTRRLKKAVYSTDWKEGKPQTRNTGISHIFKIVRLESYEDTLNNLRLARTEEQKAALGKATDEQRDAYLLGYFLDVESEGSASLLDVARFRDPFGYKLDIATSSAGETKETNVDLMETFNWLLGLKVKHIDHQRGFLSVTGERRAGGRCLILWRTLGDDEKADNAALVKYLEKITVSPADTEYDFIYVNGPHTLTDPHNKMHLIEETFHRLMFDTTNFESLS